MADIVDDNDNNDNTIIETTSEENEESNPNTNSNSTPPYSIPSESPTPSFWNENEDENDDEDDELLECTDNSNWNAQSEIFLFESIGQCPPIGANIFFSILNSSVYIQKRYRNSKWINPEAVIFHLQELYDLETLARDERDVDFSEQEFLLPEDEYGDLIAERITQPTLHIPKKQSTQKYEITSPPSSPIQTPISFCSLVPTTSPIYVAMDSSPTAQIPKVKIKNEMEEENKGKISSSSVKRKHDDKNDNKFNRPSHTLATEQLVQNKDTLTESKQENEQQQPQPPLDISNIKTENLDTTEDFKYLNFAEMLYDALISLGNNADLTTLYDYSLAHSTELHQKFEPRFEGEKHLYKSNVRSALHNNQGLFVKVNGNWQLVPGSTNPRSQRVAT